LNIQNTNNKKNNKMKNFAITGVAGYIAPRHLKAISETNNRLVAALDPHDSVGILDKYTYDVSFFTEFERFDRYLDKLRREKSDLKIDYLSICSPNYLHDAHIRLAFRIGADAICEKPLVLKPSNLDVIKELEIEYGRRVYNILQLRVHPKLIELKNRYTINNNKKYDVILTYITSRGQWYYYSWKGDEKKSGGLITNIGIHFFDLLMWIFGETLSNQIYLREINKASGFMELKNANVRWYLSIDKNDLPNDVIKKNQSTFRSIKIDNEEIEFTEGFTDLHTEVYKNILTENGFGIEEARPSIETVYNLRHINLDNKIEYPHPYLINK
jgi:UDP-N-acetyl-2-amino-2-deoxyglucuronate dehydrogenase